MRLTLHLSIRLVSILTSNLSFAMYYLMGWEKESSSSL